MHISDSDLLARFDKVALDYFDGKIKDARALDDSYAFMWQTVKDQFLSGGKRIRPLLVFSIIEAYGKEVTVGHISIGLAHELLHTALLIHDDIIDGDKLRRGVPNVSGVYEKKYTAYIDNKQALAHQVDAAAILSGDVLIAGAYDLIATADITNEEKAQCFAALSNGIFDVAGGELIDVEASFMPFGTFDPTIINRYKTTGYSFISPIITGAVLAGVPEQEQAKLHSLAQNLGSVFQLQDDYLGVFGREQETGKSTSSDIESSKFTYLIKTHCELLSVDERTDFVTQFTKKQKTTQEVEGIKSQLVASGAKAHLEGTIKKQSGDIESLVRNMNFSDQTPIHGLINAILRRNK